MVWALGGRGKRGRSAGGFSGSLGLEDRWARRYQGGTEMILRADFPFSECGLAGMGPCPKYTPVQPTKPVEDGQPFLSALESRGSPFLPKPAGSVPSISSSPRTRPALCSQPHAQCPSYFPPHHADPSSPPLSSPSALWGLVPAFCSPFSLPLARLVGSPLLRSCLSLGSEPCLARAPGLCCAQDIGRCGPLSKHRWAGGFMAWFVVAFTVSGRWLWSFGGLHGRRSGLGVEARISL